MLLQKLSGFARWALRPESPDKPGHLWPRWLFLRALGLIFFSAFYSLYFQIVGLIGPEGILPARHYLENLSHQVGWTRFWYAPSFLWLANGPVALKLLCWAGLIASVLVFLNVWPRLATAFCLVAYLSFVTTAQDFSSYQSDGMLLAAGFISLFFAPPGFLPGLAKKHPPSHASLFLLQWLWFRIYFESGIVKLASGDPQWRHLTSLYQYYSNGPLPDWIGWYAQHLPHAFNAALALVTLVIELGLVWLFFLPRRLRLLCFFIVTPFQIGIILTANLAFLNYFVLSLGILLLDDRFLRQASKGFGLPLTKTKPAGPVRRLVARWWSEAGAAEMPPFATSAPSTLPSIAAQTVDFRTRPARPTLRAAIGEACHHVSRVVTGLCLGWVFCVDTALLILLLLPWLPLPTTPIELLEPFRIANQYGLFAVMTPARYEIEFQGSRDGVTWTPYPFRYKPQDVRKAPQIFAPYQPRFDWNLWFASLGNWRQYPFVLRTQALLLTNDPSVLALFAGNPFGHVPPRFVRSVVWQYWFTSLKTLQTTGCWWKRKFVGLYAPVLYRLPNGRIGIEHLPGETDQ
ncbi:MAG TPA: lipase maturation factor family protein [Terriglobia bacterium]|nr:lipase maturation factor family protein [Terriglobia bacterium]